jgi:hypothetical protein
MWGKPIAIAARADKHELGDKIVRVARESPDVTDVDRKRLVPSARFGLEGTVIGFVHRRWDSKAKRMRAELFLSPGIDVPEKLRDLGFARDFEYPTVEIPMYRFEESDAFAGR